jgi:inorganic pyrophosphatase
MPQAIKLPARGSRGIVHVIIDTPQGSRNKFKFDDALKLFKLSRRLPAGMHFPHDFGSIPSTLGADGDALDVVVLSDNPGFVGCLMTVRLIGVIRAEQVERHRRIRHDRLVALPITPVNKPRLRQLSDVPPPVIEELEQFFVNYNKVHGREFLPTGWHGAAAAERLLEEGIRQYAQRAAG